MPSSALDAELREMNKQLNIPLSIQNYGEGGVLADKSIIDEKEFNEKLSAVAANAIGDACTGSNPRQPSQEEMEKLLLAVYYDREIDFKPYPFPAGCGLRGGKPCVFVMQSFRKAASRPWLIARIML